MPKGGAMLNGVGVALARELQWPFGCGLYLGQILARIDAGENLDGYTETAVHPSWDTAFNRFLKERGYLATVKTVPEVGQPHFDLILSKIPGQ